METHFRAVSLNNWCIPGLNEYLFVINLHGDVKEKVMEVKNDFFSQYGAAMAVKVIPHITLANFIGRDGMEETLIRWIQKICSGQSRFSVTLNNYSGFPPHTIYLRIQEHHQLYSLVNRLKVINEYITSSSCPPLKLISRPHLSIARRLPEETYNKAIAAYSQKDFHESFTVNELVLLKRNHQFDECKLVNVFYLRAENRS